MRTASLAGLSPSSLCRAPGERFRRPRQEEDQMKQHCCELPTRLEAAGVRIQALDWSGLDVARIHFPKGAEATPLLEGLLASRSHGPGR
jgi:hypothetical protein